MKNEYQTPLLCLMWFGLGGLASIAVMLAVLILGKGGKSREND